MAYYKKNYARNTKAPQLGSIRQAEEGQQPPASIHTQYILDDTTQASPPKPPRLREALYILRCGMLIVSAPLLEYW